MRWYSRTCLKALRTGQCRRAHGRIQDMSTGGRVYGVLLSNLGGFALHVFVYPWCIGYVFDMYSDGRIHGLYSAVSDMYSTCIRYVFARSREYNWIHHEYITNTSQIHHKYMYSWHCNEYNWIDRGYITNTSRIHVFVQVWIWYVIEVWIEVWI